ncbi:hypothetical protein [Tsukamurella pseudospumae]|uniref:hypothetical protein n=1 Tax=Tsukamurella pseudospumae TaxID=239498 RepID=UPI000A3F51FE|nr:hypothetical protein [Tsukamurella pseudospumae]
MNVGKNFAVVVLLGGLSAATGCGLGVKPVAGSGQADTAVAAGTSATTTTAAKPKHVFGPEDFTIKVIVTSSKCFGSAGCNVRYTIDPTYVGPIGALAGRELTVIYTVSGGEAPVIDRFTLKGTQMRYTEESSISTESSGYELSAEVTNVLEQ